MRDDEDGNGGNGPESTAGGGALHRDLAPDLGLPSWTRVQVLDGVGELAVTAGLWTTGALVTALDRRGTASLALAGGSTPGPLYRVLSGPFRWHVDWSAVRFFQGDERAVPPDDPASNHRTARQELLSRLGVPDDAVHRMQGELDPEAAARRYQEELVAALGEPPRLDLALLGLGDDGHTASLFPAAFAGHRDDPQYDPHPGRWVAATEAPGEAAGAGTRRRITLTLSTLAAARQVLFLVTGEGKGRAVRDTFAALRALDAGEAPEGPVPPAARVRPAVRTGGAGDAADPQDGTGEAGEEGTVRWLLDRAAFALAGFELDLDGANDDDPTGGTA